MTDGLRVDRAAIENTRRVFSLPRPARHEDIFRLMRAAGFSRLGCRQGFLLSDGRFVGRSEAARVAFEAGQYLEQPARVPGALMTEDLW